MTLIEPVVMYGRPSFYYTFPQSSVGYWYNIYYNTYFLSGETVP